MEKINNNRKHKNNGLEGLIVKLKMQIETQFFFCRCSKKKSQTLRGALSKVGVDFRNLISSPRTFFFSHGTNRAKASKGSSGLSFLSSFVSCWTWESTTIFCAFKASKAVPRWMQAPSIGLGGVKAEEKGADEGCKSPRQNRGLTSLLQSKCMSDRPPPFYLSDTQESLLGRI